LVFKNPRDATPPGTRLTSTVAGKYDDCILGQAVGVESLEHAADLRVHRLDHALIGLLCAPLGEKEERCERRRAGTALVWNNRETEVGDLAAIEALFFALVGGSPGAEVVFLNPDYPRRMPCVTQHRRCDVSCPHRNQDNRHRDPIAGPFL
jgi:hypothetical protein